MSSIQDFGEGAIRVLVVDDTRIHTQLLVDALRRDRQLEVVSLPVQSRDLVDTVRTHKIGVVVLSSNLDEEPLRGFELLRQLRASDPRILAIMLLDSSKREAILQAFRAGARGIFSRHDSVETLCMCIRSVHQGQIWANSEQISFAVEALASSPMVRAVDANGLSLLSKREMDVVRSLAEGLTNREIAERLGLSQHTIKNYLFRVYDKLGVSSRMELLFMTLAYAGAPGLTATIDAIRGYEESRSVRSVTPTRVSPSRLDQGDDPPQHRSPAPTLGQEPLESEKHQREAGSGARFRTAPLVGSDPLD